MRARDASGSVAHVLATRAAEATVVTLAPPAPLSIEALGVIAAGAPVALGPDVRAQLAASHRQLAELLRSGRTVYGLTTGCGPLCDRPVPQAGGGGFPRNPLGSHATRFGPAHPRVVWRATR